MPLTSKPCKVWWEIVTPGGPAKVNHVGCAIGSTLYVHGGLEKKGDRQPVDTFFSFDGQTQIWRQIRVVGSPTLSHHAAVGFLDRYVLLIGGWDGRCRTSHVYIYDTQMCCWRVGRTRGFPANAGLSSHTATMLESGKILIVGREGPLHLKTHMGSAYILNIDVDRGLFSYETYRLGVDSRSGHTTCGAGNMLVVIGGREDHMVEVYRKFERAAVPTPHSKQLRDLRTMAERGDVEICNPPARKGHVSISGPDFVFMHGGETFDGRSHWPVGDIYLLLTKPEVKWMQLADKSVNRSGHICVLFCGRILIHGGWGTNDCIHADTYTLAMQDIS